MLGAEEGVDAEGRELAAVQHGAEGEDDVEPAVEQALREGVGMRLLRSVGAGEGRGVERGGVLPRGVGETAPAVAGITGGVVRHGGIMPRAPAFGKAEASLPSGRAFARMPAWVSNFLNNA